MCCWLMIDWRIKRRWEMTRLDGRVCAPVVGHRAMVVDFRGDDGVLTSDKRVMLPVTDEPVLVGLLGAFYLSFSVKVWVWTRMDGRRARSR